MIDYTKNYAEAKTTGFDAGLREYMLKIYNYMVVALAITGVAAYVTLSVEPITQMMFTFSPSGQITGQTGIGTLISLSPIGLVLYLGMKGMSMNPEKSKVLLWVYAFLMGMALSSIGLIYTAESITKTFFISAGTFAGVSLYGYTTKNDLTSMGSFMRMGLFGLIIAIFVNMFLGSSALDLAISLLGVVIFVGLTAWDTQKLKQIYFATGGGEYGQRMAVFGALNLYMDFINLFIYMLRFLGNRRD